MLPLLLPFFPHPLSPRQAHQIPSTQWTPAQKSAETGTVVMHLLYPGDCASRVLCVDFTLWPWKVGPTDSHVLSKAWN